MREMLIEAVEKRFGAVEAIPAQHALEFLTDNGGAYIAADTRAMARSLGLRVIAEGRLSGLAIAPGEYLADIYCIQRVATLLAMEASAMRMSSPSSPTGL